MKKHVRIFLKSRSLNGHEPYFCEYCGRLYNEARSLDVHHISRRGVGGNVSLDTPNNLIGMCRFPCHADADANRIEESVLLDKVAEALRKRDDFLNLIS
jgi:hypothetical protein